MSEIAVNVVIEKLIPLLVEEVKLLRGVRGEVSKIKDDLESIQSSLKDADSKAESSNPGEGVKTWVNQVREAAYLIEDIIDEYTLHVERRRDHHGFKGFFRKVGHLLKSLKKRSDIAAQIQALKSTLQGIKHRRELYEFDRSPLQGPVGNVPLDYGVAARFVDEAELVGIEHPRAQLRAWLLEGESKRIVISLFGMGGLGKTTLAKKIYDDEKVKGHFQCHVWIDVSKTFIKEEILRTAIQQLYRASKQSLPEGINTMTETLLVQELRDYLLQMRYIVVLDDVWEPGFWGFIKCVFPDNDRHSRIMITTRKQDVVHSCRESVIPHVCKLVPLPEEESWKLFCMKAFRFEKEGCCPNELEELSRQIVKRCQGLPLAIVAIGGLLSMKKKVVSEWKTVNDNLGTELESSLRILSLSYYDLPYHLKPCFIYLGVFPEDYSIESRRVIRLWMAEGFLKDKTGKELEDVAEDYLNELVCRSLVQVSSLFRDGRPRVFRVHDMIREMILSKSKEMNFFQICTEEDQTIGEKTRRLSLHKRSDSIEYRVSRSPVRSFFPFDVEKLPTSISKDFLLDFKLMKVLDLENPSIDCIPEQVGNLLHLRYLSLKNTKVCRLPKSIGKLKNLQTLNLKNSLVRELPIEIQGLCKLRYLSAYSIDYSNKHNFNTYHGIKLRGEIGCLVGLQKLFYMEGDGGSGIVESLRKLTQLKKLGIDKLKREESLALCGAVEMLDSLRSLEVSAIEEDEVLDLQLISSPPLSLQFLTLQGRLEKFPPWISKLENLLRISLRWSRLLDDPLKVLQNLSNLVSVVLHKGFDGEQLYFEEGWFPNLKNLELIELDGLESVKIQKGALPLLENLVLGPCEKLKEVPSGIQHLRKLTDLTFCDMPHEFACTVLTSPFVGQDYWKIQHVPEIYFRYRVSYGRSNWHDLRSDEFSAMVVQGRKQPVDLYSSNEILEQLTEHLEFIQCNKKPTYAQIDALVMLVASLARSFGGDAPDTHSSGAKGFSKIELPEKIKILEQAVDHLTFSQSQLVRMPQYEMAAKYL